MSENSAKPTPAFAQLPIETIRVGIERDIQRGAEEVASAIRKAEAKYGLPATLILAIIEKESRGKKSARRFEPHIAAKLPDSHDREGLATSHGLMQVMGFNTKFCGLESWRELYDPEKNIDCASKILRRNLERFGTRNGIVAYNGRGMKAETYASVVIDRWRAYESQLTSF